MKSWSLNFLELSGPHRACYGTALPLPLTEPAARGALSVILTNIGFFFQFPFTKLVILFAFFPHNILLVLPFLFKHGVVLFG
jgi:hypothetical protein